MPANADPMQWEKIEVSTNGACGGRRCGIMPPGSRGSRGRMLHPVMVSCRQGCRNRLRSNGNRVPAGCVILHRPLGGGNSNPLGATPQGVFAGSGRVTGHIDR